MLKLFSLSQFKHWTSRVQWWRIKQYYESK